MTRSTWSPSPSPSPSSTSTSSSNSKPSTVLSQDRIEKISAKCLVEIPLVPPPIINYKNLTTLDSAEFVNIVFETDDNNAFFRISDERNQDICRILPFHQADKQPGKKGVKYLEFRDMLGNCILYVAYPIGLGEVALLSPTEELVGECMSNVEFICLSVKVKYNFYDSIGNRLMKLTAIMPEEGSKDKFILMVKRSKKEKLALIKMGSLKSCCHIKFKAGLISLLERIQIIALWAGFMHNELQDTETCALLEKQAQAKKIKKESRHQKSSIVNDDNNTIINGGNRNSKSSNDNNLNAVVTTLPSIHDSDVIHDSISSSDSGNNEISDTADKNNTLAKVKLWKNLVTFHLPRRHRKDRNLRKQYGSNNNIENNVENLNKEL